HRPIAPAARPRARPTIERELVSPEEVPEAYRGDEPTENSYPKNPQVAAAKPPPDERPAHDRAEDEPTKSRSSLIREANVIAIMANEPHLARHISHPHLPDVSVAVGRGRFSQASPTRTSPSPCARPSSRRRRAGTGDRSGKRIPA